MKPLLFIVAIFLSCSILAQKNISISHSINDDGRILSIKVKGTINGSLVDYEKTFDVSGMTREQRDHIKRHVYDSLGLADPTVPRAPFRASSPRIVMEAPTPSSPPVVASVGQYEETYAVGGDHPFTKEIKYNPKLGVLYMKYRFIKNGEEITVEKSVDAKDKSKEERDAIIRQYEKEIGIAKNEIV